MCQRYDIVCVEKDKEKVMTLQEGHGGWKPGMASVGCYFSLQCSVLFSPK